MKTKVIALICLIIQSAASNHITQQELLASCKANNIEYIEFCFTDFLGNRKSIIRPAHYLERDLQRGLSFDGSSIAGCTRITNSDMLLIPDKNIAWYTIPWIKNYKTIRIIGTMYKDAHTIYESDPRAILKKELEALNSLGYDFLIGPEIEFYIFKNNHNTILEPIDHQSYADAPNQQSIMNALISTLDILSRMGLEVEKIHHEVGEGQYEISLKCANAVDIADALTITMDALVFIAQSYNCQVSFMPKPISDKPGNGMHLNFSLYDINNKHNAFYDHNSPHRLSSVAQSFIAGVLKHAREITLLLNCTTNSFKRLIKGYEAPVFICCGQKNRSALIRLPDYDDAYPELVRAEIRSPDALCNPYLACAALLRAGREGIEKGYVLPSIITENLYNVDEQTLLDNNIIALPQTLEEALNDFERSELMQDLLGEKLFNLYCRQKRHELKSYKHTVTPWELGSYSSL